MAISSLQQQLDDVLSTLSPEDQQRVLDFARQLAGTPVGSPPENLLRLAGLFAREDLEEMQRIIDEAHAAASPPADE